MFKMQRLNNCGVIMKKHNLKEQFEEWLNQQIYSYKELNPYYEELKEFPKDLNPYFQGDEKTLRQKKLNERRSKESKFYEGGYKLKDKYAIDDTKRYESHYICGEDLYDAFVAGYNLGYKDA